MSYLEDFEKTLAEKCHQNEPPFCQAACPFRLDIKGLEEKWKKGRFNAAYRTYQNTVGFPDIVSKLCSHPCEKACLRAKLDGGIAIGLLERATVEYRSGRHRMRITCRRKEKRSRSSEAVFRGLAVHCVSAIKSTR